MQQPRMFLLGKPQKYYMEIASEFKETISLKMSLPKGKKGAKLVVVKHNNGQVTKMAAEWDTNSRMPI